MPSFNKDYSKRVYPLDAHELSEEQIAVTFAMTSRRPDPFDEIARQVNQEKAADFSEKWIVGYGHASVAEHAVIHLAIENISRLACDVLEESRLASFTEKSSRYQVMFEDSFYVPVELSQYPELLVNYIRTCKKLFSTYYRLINECADNLKLRNKPRSSETQESYDGRMRRIATDSCRSILPAATLTNVGITANARVLEHSISKLMSSDVQEVQELGLDIRDQSREIIPTLIKYADSNPLLINFADKSSSADLSLNKDNLVTTELVESDPNSLDNIIAALLFANSYSDYNSIVKTVSIMDEYNKKNFLFAYLESMGQHDAPPREFELAQYKFRFVMDYGALREFRRHRMMSSIYQYLNIWNGFRVPALVVTAGMEDIYNEAMKESNECFEKIYKVSPSIAQYVVTHGHYQQILSSVNLRELYHLFKLRSSKLAHFAIRQPILDAMKLVVSQDPILFEKLQLKDYPEWWPFNTS